MSGTILVTGGAGYIGAHTCKALARAGYRPVVYDDLATGHRSAVRWGPLEEGALEDTDRLVSVIRAHKPDAVIHFAAFSEAGQSMRDPLRYYRNNVAGSLGLLEAMRAADLGRIVFSSTAAVYGLPPGMPITETAPQEPINPYGRTKLMVEQMLADFATAHGLNWIALRYFNAAGADPDGELGEDHDPETHLIPLVLDAASGRRAAITVYGTDYDTPDGTCIRDYIHVSDLARAHVGAVQALENGVDSGAFNLGNGNGYSVREVIAAAAAATGLDIPVTYGDRRPGDPARLIASAERAREVLGWQPEITDLTEIIRTAWAWHQKGARR